MDKNHSLLYVGPLQPGGTCFQRLIAFKKIGFKVVALDTKKKLNPNLFIKIILVITERYLKIRDIYCINKKLLNLISNKHFNILWFDKCTQITPKTLIKIKKINNNIILVFFSPDDMFNPNNQTPEYLNSIPLYDYHVTTKSFNISELYDKKAKNVIMMDNGYCKEYHHKIDLSETDKKQFGGEVGFIGYWELERENYLTFLAENNIKVRIWGPWSKKREYHKNLIVEYKLLLGLDYAQAISSFDINLCFLRKENRDKQTTRSIEIPACEGFMLAERSDEHLSLFQEDVEAVFFNSKSELLDKVIFYLKNNNLRSMIANAGYIRCVKGGYSYEDRLNKLMNSILKKP